jgi:preprotein translocase subunit SecF
MELFRNPKIDWIGKKWVMIAATFLLGTAGIASLIARGGPLYGVDFRGGTVLHVKFIESPPLDRIRAALSDQDLGEVSLQQYGPDSQNEVLISLGLQVTEEVDLDAGRRRITTALQREFGSENRPNWNEIGAAALAEQLAASNALESAGMTPEALASLAQRMVNFRDSPPRSGVIGGFEELRSLEGVTPEVLQALQANYSLPGFAIRSVEIVGPRVGAALRRQALSATLLGIASMLVYIAVRFEWIYGVAAVLALVHDVVITVGFLSLANVEISLTVIAALLTLIGYSVNDKVVIFDRVRENVRLMRRDSMTTIANLSINQTLSRTILTGGITFFTVLSLYLFGGEILQGFSLVLVVGILVGTYSSVAVASPLVVSWQDYSSRHRRGGAERVAVNRGKARGSKVGAGAGA